jgi:hypothetical protein
MARDGVSKLQDFGMKSSGSVGTTGTGMKIAKDRKEGVKCELFS